jgi:transcriptional regulator with XRE-family HTH domain
MAVEKPHDLDAVNAAIAANLVSIANFRRIARPDLAEAMGMHPSTLSRKLAGHQRFFADELALAAQTLAVPTEVFFRPPDEVQARITELSSTTIWYSPLAPVDMPEEQMELALVDPPALTSVR